MYRPSLVERGLILVAAISFCSLARNPIVYLQASLGLSPAPLERLTGFKTVFSGMSEAFHRMATGDFWGAFSANFLAPPFAMSLIIATLLWRWPRLNGRLSEAFFFSAVAVASFAINILHEAE
ncbi:DUF2752 domain-containing protein [Roseovarius mucosus]|uniref:DUF2752 domain-containing protein n=1 Tax=Roseovarius mucosus TaxID=215743 RepID=UPI003F7134E9